MKILYPHITQNLGGVEKRFFTYFSYIVTLPDHEYTVLISRSFLDAIGEDLNPSYNNKIIRYGFSWGKKSKITRYIDYLCLIAKIVLLFHQSYDVIHFNTSGSRMFRNWFRGKVKFISAVTSPKDWLYREISSSRFKKMISQDFGVDCLDSNIKAAISKMYPKKQTNFFEAPCSFVPKKLESLSIHKKTHSICFVGRLIPEKGADMLLEVLPDIIGQTTFKIFILGNGNLKPNFLDLIAQNGWSDRVEMTYDSFPPNYMAKSKIFLSLQRDENYPSQSLLEAMLCGNAVIATNVGLTQKIVNQKNGILISNPQELVSAICTLERNPDELNSMAQNSRQSVLLNHNVEKFHEYLITSYSALLREKQ